MRRGALFVLAFAAACSKPAPEAAKPTPEPAVVRARARRVDG